MVLVENITLICMAALSNMTSYFAGCGKTLAYLLPIIEKIKTHQRVFGKHNDVNSPYAIILVPSRELAEQISVCKPEKSVSVLNEIA